jgi:adenylate kinase family enzyme
MYAVVGCDECSALWIVEGRPDTSQCPRCSRTRNHEKRRKFVTTEDEDHAREVRSSMLAARQGHDELFAELDSFAELDDQVEAAGIDDETYLAESGVDTDEVEAAADRLDSTAGSTSREEVVREALRELEEPTEPAVVSYAKRHDVSSSYTERALQKLLETGEVSQSQGVYRLL